MNKHICFSYWRWSSLFVKICTNFKRDMIKFISLLQAMLRNCFVGTNLQILKLSFTYQMLILYVSFRFKVRFIKEVHDFVNSMIVHLFITWIVILILWKNKIFYKSINCCHEEMRKYLRSLVCVFSKYTGERDNEYDVPRKYECYWNRRLSVSINIESLFLCWQDEWQELFQSVFMARLSS